MKRNILIKLFTFLIIVLTACNFNNKKSDKKTVTVTTSFIYDMVNQIVDKDTINLELVIPYGVDPHLYDAKPNDLVKIKNADLLLYHGLHFEGKMQNLLKKDGVSITSTFKDEDLIYMEEDGFMVVDPHFWFDLDLYKEAFRNVSKALIELLPDKEPEFEEKTILYLNKIDELKVEVLDKLSLLDENKRYLVTPHDAFNYFERAFNISVVAPQGLSTESEVSNADLENTANFIIENQIKAIFTESTTNPQRMEKLQEICKRKGFTVSVVSGEDNELLSDSLAQIGSYGDTFIDMFMHNINLIVNNLK